MPAKKNGNGSTALQVIKDVPYPVLAEEGGPAILNEVLEAGADQWKFTRLKIPAGGGTTWEFNTVAGTQKADALHGVIAYHRGKQLSWWREGFEDSGGGTPPDCASADAITGNGDNGTGIGTHKCKDCPHFAWGSDRKGGRGKDCRETIQIFLFREGSHLPNLLVVPPTSINAVISYATLLGEAGMYPGQVVTEFTLERDKNPQGIAYSKLKLKPIAQLPPDEAERMRQVRGMLAEHLVGRIIDIEPTDVSGE
jgi:hypothetical protein